MEMDEKLREVLRYFTNMGESDAVMRMLSDEDFSDKDIIDYLEWCEKRRCAGDAETDFDAWLVECGRNYKVEWFRRTDDGVFLGSVRVAEHLSCEEALRLACMRFKEINNCTVQVYKDGEIIAVIS